MSKSTTVKSQFRKKPGPKPTGKGAPILVRLQPEMLDAIDDVIDRKDSETIHTRPQAIRAILRAWLRDHGYLKSDK